MQEVLGWVYAMSNAAMPGLIKVGFSLKDPVLRANELFSTGVPSRFCIEYCALVHSPERIEGAVHRFLASKNHDKEFFSCSLEEVVSAIRKESGSSLVLERKESLSKVIKPAPSELWKDIRTALLAANMASKEIGHFRRIFLEIETIYRHLEAIDFRLADEFSDAVTAGRQSLSLPAILGANGLQGALEISCQLKAEASNRLSDFCDSNFYGDIESFRLFTELRLVGHWDLADSLRTQRLLLGNRASSRELLLQVRCKWGTRKRVRVLCGLNSVLINGGALILASPPKWLGYHPRFDLYYSGKFTCMMYKQSGETDLPFIGVPTMLSEALLKQATDVDYFDLNKFGSYTLIPPTEYTSVFSSKPKVEALLRLSNNPTKSIACISIRRALTLAYSLTATADMPAICEGGFPVNRKEWGTHDYCEPHDTPSSVAAFIALQDSLRPLHLSIDGEYQYLDNQANERVLRLRQF